MSLRMRDIIQGIHLMDSIMKMPFLSQAGGMVGEAYFWQRTVNQEQALILHRGFQDMQGLGIFILCAA